jgi:condensin complex subunit 3
MLRTEKIFIETFDILAKLTEENEDEQDMIPLAQAGLMMIDWTDPSKAV